MNTIPVKVFCPLGAECESVKDGAIHRCAWYAKVRGKDDNTGDIIDEWRCSMNWMPMLIIENSNMQRTTAVAVEDFRNEMVKANETGQQMLLATAQGLPIFIGAQK